MPRYWAWRSPSANRKSPCPTAPTAQIGQRLNMFMTVFRTAGPPRCWPVEPKSANSAAWALALAPPPAPSGAITIGEDHLPKIDPTLCTGCGTCERACPKNIIHLSSVSDRILQFQRRWKLRGAMPGHMSGPDQYSGLHQGRGRGALRRRGADHQGTQPAAPGLWPRLPAPV